MKSKRKLFIVILNFACLSILSISSKIVYAVRQIQIRYTAQRKLEIYACKRT